MATNRDKLVEDYAVHYNRMQHGKIDPRGMLPSRRGKYELDFGDLVAKVPSGGKVLDLGCGTGNLLAWLAEKPGVAPVGVDGSSTQVEIAKKFLPDVEIHCADGLAFLRENKETFSGIICTDVLEHIPGKDLCIDWVKAGRDALKPGGFFFCRMPNAGCLLGSFSRYRDLTHECSFTSSSIFQLLEAANFTNIQVRPIRAPNFSGKARLWIEKKLHQVLFRICGEAGEDQFTSNICAVGYRGAE